MRSLTMRLSLLCVICMVSINRTQADGMAEVNEWRRRTGLPTFTEDPQMTAFAQAKARYRAERGLQNGHQGPNPPAGWHEGTGEATSTWGWLTCEMESDFKVAGAGVCVAADGTRYMVLVCRNGSGRALVSRNNTPVHRTSHLTPNPPRVGDDRVVAKKVAIEDSVASKALGSSQGSVISKSVASKSSSSNAPTTANRTTTKPIVTAKATVTNAIPRGNTATSKRLPCPKCGRYH